MNFIAQAQDISVDGMKDEKELLAESAFLDGMKEYIAENYAKSAEIFENVISTNDPTAGMYHMLAKSQLAQYDINSASLSAKSSLDLDKNNLYYQKFYAGILAEQLDYHQAIDLYKKIIRNNPLDITSYLLLSEIYITLEDYDKAIKLYNQVERNIGDDEEISYRKQMLYLKQNKVEEAIKEGDRLIENQPLESEYVLKQAQIMINNQKLSEAELLLLDYLKSDANLAEGHVLLADIYRRQGDLNACHSELLIAFDNPNLASEIKLEILRSYVKMVEEVQETEHINQAIILTEKLIDLEPELAGSYIIKGDLLMRKGLLEEARVFYLKSTEFDKSIFEVWLALIELDTKLNDIPSLINHAENAVDYFPNQAFFWYHLGYGNFLLKDYQEAIYSLDEARNLAFDNEELLKHILALLGDAYSATDQFIDSENSYDAVLKIDPDYTAVLNNYSYFLALRKKNLEKAMSMASHLVSLYPDNGRFLDTQAWVHFQKEEYSEAKIIIEKAIQVSENDNGTVLEHYGDILFKMGEEALALEQWEKAKSIGGNSVNIDQKITEKKYIE